MPHGQLSEHMLPSKLAQPHVHVRVGFPGVTDFLHCSHILQPWHLHAERPVALCCAVPTEEEVPEWTFSDGPEATTEQPSGTPAAEAKKEEPSATPASAAEPKVEEQPSAAAGAEPKTEEPKKQEPSADSTAAAEPKKEVQPSAAPAEEPKKQEPSATSAEQPKKDVPSGASHCLCLGSPQAALAQGCICLLHRCFAASSFNAWWLAFTVQGASCHLQC